MVFSQSEKEQLEKDIWAGIREELRAEVERSRQEAKEINLLLEQSQVELNKLAQKNASITGRLQQIQAQLDRISKDELRAGYEAALDSQQRLFVMRGQIERLQSDGNRLTKQIAIEEKVLNQLDAQAEKPSSTGKIEAQQTVEMIVQAQEAERQRLARQMHDEPAQALSNFILQTEIAMRLFSVDPAKAKEELSNLKTSATNTFQKVRDFIFELRPMMLDDLGIAPTLNRYIDAIKQQSGTDIRISVSGLEQRLEPYLEVTIFRAIQELVGNAVRHSQANLIKVQVDMLGSVLRACVDDNGKGFDPETALQKGMGIKLIRDRVEMLGGSLEIDSVVGQGTRITFQVPASTTKVFA